MNMKKKILCIGLISIFILSTFTSASALFIKNEKLVLSVNENIETNENIIDLTVEFVSIEIRYSYPPEEFPWYPAKFSGYNGKVKISNIGTKALPDDSNLEILLIAEFEGKEVYRHKYSIYDLEWLSEGGLGPGGSFIKNVYWSDGTYPDNKVKSESTLKVEINPDGKVNEQNYDNNYIESVGSKSNSKNVRNLHCFSIINLLRNLRIFK